MNVASALARQAAAITRQNLASAAEEARILETFGAADIDLLSLKGTALTRLASPARKTAWDIDLLISLAVASGR